MQFTGRNLALVRQALDLAVADVHNEIATCPDIDDDEYAEHLAALTTQHAEIQRLIDRIDRRHPRRGTFQTNDDDDDIPFD